MTQPELDFSRTHARSSDPVTSKRAAGRVASAASAQRERIYWELLSADRPLTAHDLATLTGLTQVQCCRRLPDLERKGRAEPTGETRPGPTGYPERLWRLRKVGYGS